MITQFRSPDFVGAPYFDDAIDVDCRNAAIRSLTGEKRTWLTHAQNVADDLFRILATNSVRDPYPELRACYYGNEESDRAVDSSSSLDIREIKHPWRDGGKDSDNHCGPL